MPPRRRWVRTDPAGQGPLPPLQPPTAARPGRSPRTKPHTACLFGGGGHLKTFAPLSFFRLLLQEERTCVREGDYCVCWDGPTNPASTHTACPGEGLTIDLIILSQRTQGVGDVRIDRADGTLFVSQVSIARTWVLGYNSQQAILPTPSNSVPKRLRDRRRHLLTALLCANRRALYATCGGEFCHATMSGTDPEAGAPGFGGGWGDGSWIQGSNPTTA